MKKRLPEILCMAAVLVGLLALAVQARAEQTHRAYLYGYPDGTIRPEAEVSRAAFACILLRLAGASPGDVVSLYLGASGTPYGTYLSAGLLGGLPRIACATVLGGALWQPGSGRFWLSLAAGGALTALSGVIWLLWRRRRRA